MTLKNTKTSLRAVIPVCLSAFGLSLVQGIVGRFIKGGALISLIPYLLGWACAVLVFVMLARLFPIFSPEEDEVLPKGAGGKRRVLTIATAAAVLVGMNLALYFVSGGGTPRGGMELLLSGVMGVLLKPPLEEFLFRYMYLRRLVRYANGSYLLPILAQAAFFALWHSPESLVFAFFGGVVIGASAAVSFDGTEDGFRRGFANALAVHALHNLILYVIEWYMATGV